MSVMRVVIISAVTAVATNVGLSVLIEFIAGAVHG